jgi:endonuclease/exonuclease/phosphatase family metal-dependent hydrolase
MCHRFFAGLVCCLLCCFASVTQGDELPEKLRIVTWNLEWFYDDYTGDNPSKLARDQSAPTSEDWQWRLEVVGNAIAKLDPTILCLQEVESRRTMFALVKHLREKHKLDYRLAFIEGSDVFTEQDVCILAKSGLIEFSRKEQSKEMFQSKDYYDLQKHLFATFEWGTGDAKQRLTLLNVHMRSMEDADAIRQRQARLCQRWLQEKLSAGEHVILLGDTNTNSLDENPASDSDLGILRGLHTPEVHDDLFDAHALIPAKQRATHIILKQFDRILVSRSLREATPGKKHFVLTSANCRADVNTRGQEQDKDHWNIYWKISADERDVSDHFPVVADFELK